MYMQNRNRLTDMDVKNGLVVAKGEGGEGLGVWG